MKIKRLHADNYIAFVVLLQSLLVVFQHVLIFVFHIPEEITTEYRVILTALPLSVAIALTMYRKWYVFFVVYSITILILLINLTVFPQNSQYIRSQSIRFLLPVVIPSALCLMYVSNIEIVEKALYKISWVTTILVLIFVVNFFIGTFRIHSYSMGLSYALLLPMITLYSKKTVYSLLAAFFLFLTILAIGSRGAAVIFFVYLIYDLFQSNKKLVVLILLILGVLILLLPIFAQWLQNVGISSRTLKLLLSERIITHMSGRDLIYEKMINVFFENPIKGIGLFGDRYYLNGAYTHNLILELFLNWGFIGATLILGFFSLKFIITFKKSNKANRNILIKYFLAGVMPLMFSGSYLTNYDLGVFIGVLFLVNKKS
ncbi:O-antigen ligase family protein [Tangfeifania diversioriginum]|uniref:O-antigen ligase family protein n=1 Tax=Tangfeifania diversioriginum TaxID=1168035 RepID=UPI001114B2A3|nr:O-antigen ligase family protein [Tangfeifania diversioriginum]